MLCWLCSSLSWTSAVRVQEGATASNQWLQLLPESEPPMVAADSIYLLKAERAYELKLSSPNSQAFVAETK